MKTKIRYTAAILVFVLLVIGTLSTCQRDSDRWVHKAQPESTLQVDQLLDGLSSNDSHLINDVIAVDGFVAEVNYLNDRATVLLRGSAEEKISVICDMQENQKEQLALLEVGQPITIKGILKGSLNDVILLNCMISNSPNHD